MDGNGSAQAGPFSFFAHPLRLTAYVAFPTLGTKRLRREPTVLTNDMEELSPKARVILYQVRDDGERLRREYASFLSATGLEASELHGVDVIGGAIDRADLEDADAVIIGGSRFGVTDDVPNLAALRAALERAVERRIPVFGVCFGAQFIAHVFGGEVRRDLAAAELGTATVRTTDDAAVDLLFADIPDVFFAQQMHRDRIVSVPPGAVVLAESDVCPVQAFAMPGADVYGTQFHPEVTATRMRELLGTRDYSRYGLSDVSHILDGVRESDEAHALLRTFIDRTVRAAWG